MNDHTDRDVWLYCMIIVALEVTLVIAVVGTIGWK
jgi:hypothetical protein